MQRYYALLVSALLASACSDSTSHSRTEGPNGGYRASTYTIVTEGDTLDLLADGGTIVLDFNRQGRIAGFIFPGKDTIHVTGAWNLTSEGVRFKTSPVTFLEELAFSFDGTTLAASQVIRGTTYLVTLTEE